MVESCQYKIGKDTEIVFFLFKMEGMYTKKQEKELVIGRKSIQIKIFDGRTSVK